LNQSPNLCEKYCNLTKFVSFFNRNGNLSNQNRQQTNHQTNDQNTKNIGPGFKQTYHPGSQYQNIKCGAGGRTGCSAEPVRTVGTNNIQKTNVNQRGNNANIQNIRNNQNGQNRGTNNMKTNRQQLNRQQANDQPNNQNNQNGRWNNRNNNRQQTHQKTNAQNQRAKNTQNRPRSGSGFDQTYEPGSKYQNFKCGTRECLGGQVRTA